MVQSDRYLITTSYEEAYSFFFSYQIPGVGMIVPQQSVDLLTIPQKIDDVIKDLQHCKIYGYTTIDFAICGDQCFVTSVQNRYSSMILKAQYVILLSGCEHDAESKFLMCRYKGAFVPFKMRFMDSLTYADRV
jgi:hypothetical protein